MATSEKFMIGRQLLDVMTSGMYDNPLMVYREYIQNAVDSIDQLVANDLQALGHCEIKIQIDGLTRTVVIEDTGAGLPESTAAQTLLSLGFSPKEDGGFRGFRGIGRLGGLGYCDTLKFETRSSSSERVTEVIWSRSRLDELAASKGRISLEEALHHIVETCDRAATEYEPSNFFRVTLENVRRFHSDQIMQVSKVRDYLAQVAPVPFSAEFSIAARIEKHLEDVPGYRSYNVFVNDQKIYRCYEDKIEFSEKRNDKIDDFKDFEIFGENNETIAKGWIAKLKYYGSLPPQNSMRGIRVRQGNIEVGGEYSLAEHYAESRFATWQVGEIHVAMNSLKANARRDGFENCPNYEKFLEFVSRIGTHLSKLCRQESRNRNNHAKAINSIEHIKENLQHTAIYIDYEHFNGAKKSFLKDLSVLKEDIEKYNLPISLASEVEGLENGILNNDFRVNLFVNMVNLKKFNNKSGKKAFLEFVKVVVKNKGKNRDVDLVLLKSLSGYFKGNVVNNDELEFSNAGI